MSDELVVSAPLRVGNKSKDNPHLVYCGPPGETPMWWCTYRGKAVSGNTKEEAWANLMKVLN